MNNYSKEYLDFCLKVFNKILKIQEKAMYSYTELSNLVKDIENEISNVQYEKETLIGYLDRFYKEVPNNDIGIHMIQLDRFRSVFHKPLKETGQNPLK